MKGDFDLKLMQLRYFKTICEYNNITQASNILHVSQPALSSTIKELEKEFGITLFYRLSKGLILTEEGSAFLKEVNKLLEAEDQFFSQIEKLKHSVKNVRVGIPPVLSAMVFPRLIHSFQENYPGEQLHVVENGTVTNKSLVAGGELDAAIISCNGPLSSFYDSYDLCQLEVLLYISEENPVSAYRLANISQIKDMPLVLLSKDTYLTSLVYQKYEEAGLSPKVLFHTNQIASIINLVKNNTAATILFEKLLELPEGITGIPIEGFPTVQIKLIWKKSSVISPSLLRLINLAKKEFPKGCAGRKLQG